MQQQIGRPMSRYTYSVINNIHDDTYSERAIVDADIVSVQPQSKNATGKRIRYILKSGAIVTKHLPSNTYIWH